MRFDGEDPSHQSNEERSNNYTSLHWRQLENFPSPNVNVGNASNQGNEARNCFGFIDKKTSIGPNLTKELQCMTDNDKKNKRAKKIGASFTLCQ